MEIDEHKIKEIKDKIKEAKEKIKDIGPELKKIAPLIDEFKQIFQMPEFKETIKVLEDFAGLAKDMIQGKENIEMLKKKIKNLKKDESMYK